MLGTRAGMGTGTDVGLCIVKVGDLGDVLIDPKGWLDLYLESLMLTRLNNGVVGTSHHPCTASSIGKDGVG